jgi:hypothetical protein
MRHQTLLGHADSSQHIKILMAFVVQNIRYAAREKAYKSFKNQEWLL